MRDRWEAIGGGGGGGVTVTVNGVHAPRGEGKGRIKGVKSVKIMSKSLRGINNG